MVKNKNKIKLRTPFKLLFALIVLYIVFTSLFNGKEVKVDLSKMNIIDPIKLHREVKQRYSDCTAKPLEEQNFNESTLTKKQDIISYSKKYDLRYAYEDLNFGYRINYNENSSVYGASLIKLVTAIYLIDKDEDLNKTMKYTSEFVSGSSDGMKNKKIGSNVSLKELMKYSISVSDNTAHHMLISYIGKNNLKEYAKSLGATAIFSGVSDDYGNQNTHDTAIYLKRSYELINTKENGKLLKEYMLNTKKNNLNIENYVTIAHKYGSYNIYFHDIGINFDDHPYTISVLTTKGDPNGGNYINHLSKLTKEFNDLYYENHLSYCKEYSLKKD